MEKNNIENFDILNELEINTQIQETEVVEEKIEKKKNSFLASFILMVKYLTTSATIFAVLLLTTNYSAYTNMAKSYLYPEELSQKENKLISSVEASSIKEKFSKEKEEEKQKQETEKRLSIKKMKKQEDKKDLNLNIEITPYQNRVIIPKIGKNIPLVDIKNTNISWEEELNNIFMKELEKGIIRYPGSAKPGKNGNSFIFGHSSNFPWMKWNFNEVFALLNTLEYNDEVIIYYWQEKFVYKIKTKKVIKPGQVWVLESKNNKSEVTLMTCWPLWTTLNRLIVTWELTKQ